MDWFGKERDDSCEPPVTLRAAGPEDAEAIHALSQLPAFRYGTMRLPFRPVRDTRRWLESLGESDTLLVAEVDGLVVGQAGLRRLGGRRAHCGKVGMGVHADWRGRGIGTALMAALLDTADNRLHMKRVELTVYVDNDAAIALYRKFGFETEGTLRAYAFRARRFVDALAMARVRVQ